MPISKKPRSKTAFRTSTKAGGPAALLKPLTPPNMLAGAACKSHKGFHTALSADEYRGIRVY
jgi:hypothetical protein